MYCLVRYFVQGGVTCLWLASYHGHLDCVAFLLEQRADATLCNEVLSLLSDVFLVSVAVPSIYIPCIRVDIY